MKEWWQDEDFVVDEQAPWAILDELPALIERKVTQKGYPQVRQGVWIAPTAVVAPSAVLLPPCLVMDGATVGEWAYLRGNCILGKGARVGHAVEVKGSVLMRGATAAHFNYVGDSVLGAHAHLGAGAVLSNLRLDEGSVKVTWRGERVDSGRRKLGAIVGAYAQIGCNAVLNPGTVVEPKAWVLPLERVIGYRPKEKGDFRP